MAQIYNAGDDFVRAFHSGLQDRLEGQKTSADLAERKELLPHRIASMRAEIELLKTQGEHTKSLIATAQAQEEARIRQEFAAGTRLPTSLNAGAAINQDTGVGSDGMPINQQNLGIGLSPDSTQTVQSPLFPEGQRSINGLAFPKDILKQKLSEIMATIPLEAYKAGAVATATEAPKTAGQLQVEGAKFKNTKELKDIELKNQKDIASAHDQAALDRANVEASARASEGELNRLKDIKVAGIHVDGQIKAATLRANAVANVDPTSLTGYEDAVMSGGIQFANLPKDAKNALTKDWGAKGFIPPTKQALGVLKSIPIINDILHQALDMAKNNSGITAPISEATGYGQTANKLRALNGLGGQLAELFSKEVGRKNDNDIKRAVGLLYNAKASTQGNIKNVNDAAKILVDIVKPHLAPYMKSGQADILLKLQGIDSGSILDPELVKELKELNGVK